MDGGTRFTERTALLLDRAATICGRRGGRLTDIRREVLGLVLDGARPIGAYDLLDRLRAVRRGAAPPTVYRALDFLLEHGLIHKIESLSAFVGCVHDHDHHGHDDHRHGDVQFLICRRCGRTVELESAAISEALRRAATTAGFSPQRATVEIEGFCVDCGAAGMLDGERLPTNA